MLKVWIAVMMSGVLQLDDSTSQGLTIRGDVISGCQTAACRDTHINVSILMLPNPWCPLGHVCNFWHAKTTWKKDTRTLRGFVNFMFLNVNAVYITYTKISFQIQLLPYPPQKKMKEKRQADFLKVTRWNSDQRNWYLEERNPAARSVI